MNETVKLGEITVSKLQSEEVLQFCNTLIQIVKLSQEGFIKPDTGVKRRRDNDGEDFTLTNCNSTGVVRDSSHTRKYADAAYRKLADVLGLDVKQ